MKLHTTDTENERASTTHTRRWALRAISGVVMGMGAVGNAAARDHSNTSSGADPSGDYEWVVRDELDETNIFQIVSPLLNEPAPEIQNKRDVRHHLRTVVQPRRITRKPSGDELLVHYQTRADDWFDAAQEMGVLAEAMWGWYLDTESPDIDVVRVHVYGRGDLLFTYHIEMEWIETFHHEYHVDFDGMSFPDEEFAFTVAGTVEIESD